MRKHALKGISVCLMVTMLGGVLAGCGASETKTEEYAGEAAVTEETAQAPASDETQSEQTDSYETGDVATEAERGEGISDAYEGLYEWNLTADAAGNGAAEKQMEEEQTTYLYPDYYEPENTEEYEKAEENGFCITAVEPLSTFSADVDTASYANVRRMMAATDFNDDTKDAGEIGAGHSVVALYEIIPAGAEDEITLKYQNNNKTHNDVLYTDYATVSVRYKEPGKKESKKKSYVVAEDAYVEKPSDDFVFASLVAEFAMILSDSDNKGTSDFETILDTYKTLDAGDEYKDEFYYLVKQVAKR